MVTFANSHLFWILIVWIVFSAGLIIFQRRQFKKKELFISPELWPKLMPGMDPKKSFWKTLFLILALFCICLSYLRPKWGYKTETLETTGLDIAIVMDISQSMEAEDVPPSRIKKAKHWLKNFIFHMQGDRMALIPFAGTAYVAAPLTSDSDYILELLELLSPKMITNQGTDIGQALETAIKTLDQASELQMSQAAGLISKVILLISDGEDHEEKVQAMASQMKEKGIFYVGLGVGTGKGTPIPIRDEHGQLFGFKRDAKGQSILTKFNAITLKQIAQETSGYFYPMTGDESEMNAVVSLLGKNQRGKSQEKQYQVLQERFQIILAFGVLFFVMYLLLHFKWVQRRKEIPLMVGMLIIFQGSSAWAYNYQSYQENKKAIDALKKNNPEEAQKHFDQALKQSPDAPELKFNKGVGELSGKNWDQAIESFKSAGEDPRFKGYADYNLGHAYTQKNQIQDALRSYLSAIENAKKMGDSDLERDARKNIELLLNQQQQKQQQDKNQQEQGEQGQQGQQGQQSPDSPQKPQGQQGQQGQQNQQDPNKHKQKGKFSKEEVEKILKELGNKEKELQKKMKAQKQGQNRNAQTKKQKDW